jgi:hypothetical protein
MKESNVTVRIQTHSDEGQMVQQPLPLGHGCPLYNYLSSEEENPDQYRPDNLHTPFFQNNHFYSAK